MIEPTDEPRHYKKKPVIISAMLFDGSNMDAVLDWISKGGTRCRNDGKNIIIATLEGDMIANVGDYVIKGVKDEFYPCKPDIFEQTYTRAY